MSEQEIPPWLREQLSRLQQLQQNLQAILMQKQQIEVESIETTKALEELMKLGEEDVVYKSAGPLLMKTKKNDALKELEEKKEPRVKENLKEVENKINEMIRIGQGQTGSDLGSGGTPVSGS